MQPIKAPSQAGIGGLAQCGTIECMAVQGFFAIPAKGTEGRDGFSVSVLAVRDAGICITP